MRVIKVEFYSDIGLCVKVKCSRHLNTSIVVGLDKWIRSAGYENMRQVFSMNFARELCDVVSDFFRSCFFDTECNFLFGSLNVGKPRHIWKVIFDVFDNNDASYLHGQRVIGGFVKVNFVDKTLDLCLGCRAERNFFTKLLGSQSNAILCMNAKHVGQLVELFPDTLHILVVVKFAIFDVVEESVSHNVVFAFNYQFAREGAGRRFEDRVLTHN